MLLVAADFMAQVHEAVTMMCYIKNVNECRQSFKIWRGDTLSISTSETLGQCVLLSAISYLHVRQLCAMWSD